MATLSGFLFLICLGYLLPVSVAVVAIKLDIMWFSNHLQLIVEEGRSHPVTVETSLSEYQQTCATVHLVTLQEYEKLANDSQFVCKTSLIDLVRAHSNQTQVSLIDLDPAEDVDFSNRSYDISFDSGSATFNLEVADDDIFENEEAFVMYTDILQNETLGNASLVLIRDNDELSFTWNVPRINVYEDEGTIDKLWIIKHGNNEQNITVNIQVDEINDNYEARNGDDFSLLQSVFMFGPDVNNLSVPFEVYNDTVDETPEHFYLNFTYQYGQAIIQPVGHEATVTVNILERITFITQPQDVNADFGERVEMQCTSRSRAVPSWTIGFPNGSISSYPISFLPAYIKPSYEGIDVTVQNLNLNLTNYTCSFSMLVPDLMTGALVTTSLLSQTGILTITFPSVFFHLSRQFEETQSESTHVREGDIVYFRIIKQGGENYTYNVTVQSTDSRISDKLLFIFDRNIDKLSATIRIPNKLNQNLKEFKIVITAVRVKGYGRIVGIDTGEPLTVTILYDNNYIIEFIPSEVNMSQESTSNYNICARIARPSVADLQIPIQISLSVSEKCVTIKENEILLNSTYQTTCFEISSSTHCCHDFTLQPKWIIDGNYNVTLQPPSINFTISDDCQYGGSAAELIYIPIILILIIIVANIISIIVIVVRLKRCRGNSCNTTMSAYYRKFKSAS